MAVFLFAYHFRLLAGYYAHSLKPIARMFVSKVLKREQQIMLLVAFNEFFLALGQIFAVFTPYRSLMVLLMVMNFLQMRYMTSAYLQMVFSQIRLKIDDFAPRMPSVIATIWYKFRDFLVQFSTTLIMQRMQQEQQANQQQQQQQQEAPQQQQ